MRHLRAYWTPLLTSIALLVALLSTSPAHAIFIEPGSEQSFYQALEDYGYELEDYYGANYSAFEVWTSVEPIEFDGKVTAMVRFTIGCKGNADIEPVHQYVDRRVIVSLADEVVIYSEAVEPPRTLEYMTCEYVPEL